MNCNVVNCEKPVLNKRRSLCSAHYLRFMRHGHTASELIDRSEFQKFEDKYIPEPNTGCWLWLGNQSGSGYGMFWYGKRHGYAHRFAYEHYRSAIPKDLEPDHLCRVRHCVNPWHLELVTHKENTLRGDSPTAVAARRITCKEGHAYSQNKYQRYCRICHRIWQREAARVKYGYVRRFT